MILTKSMLQVAQIASKHATRYILNGLFVEKNGEAVYATATDGRMLLATKSTLALTDDDFPKVENLPSEDPAFTSVVIPADAVSRILKSLPSKATLPILHMAKMVLHKNGGEGPLATFATTNMETTSVFTAQGLDGNYPTYRAIIPPVAGMRRPRVNIPLLLKLLKALSDIGIENVTLGVPESPVSAIRLDGKTDGLKAIGVLMPMSPEDSDGVPA